MTRAVLTSTMILSLLMADVCFAQISGPVISTFDTTLDGWALVPGQLGSVRHVSTEGNPGGYLQFTDTPTTIATSGHTFSPPRYLGDWSQLDGAGILSWDHRILDYGPDLQEVTNLEAFISGPGGSATFESGIQGSTDWVSVEAPIAQSAWNLTSGSWADLIAEVTSLRIKIEVVVGRRDVAGIDNGRLEIPRDIQAVVNAASFLGTEIAPGQIVSLFGIGLADINLAATSTPLPESLGGATVKIIDSAGTEHIAQLFFVSPNQINLFVPLETALGPGEIKLERSVGPDVRFQVNVAPVAPGLFAMNGNGQGVAAAFALTVGNDGSRTTVPVFQFDQPSRAFVPSPIDLGAASDQVFLLLFGTGVRGASVLPTVLVGGQVVTALAAVPQGEFVGLDQVNIGPLPRSLLGRGEVEILVFVDGKQANAVTVQIR